MKTTIVLLTILLLSSLCFQSCVKDGPIGPQGAQGASGTNGANGVANISSTIINITPSEWSNIGGGEYEYGYVDTSLSNANTDGIEMFYVADTYPTLYRAVPCSNVEAVGDQLSYDYATGGIDFFYFYSSAPTGTLTFKIVIIPPAIFKQHPNTNWRDYGQVNAVINAQKSE